MRIADMDDTCVPLRSWMLVLNIHFKLTGMKKTERKTEQSMLVNGKSKHRRLKRSTSHQTLRSVL